jgi:hypothetical protein
MSFDEFRKRRGRRGTPEEREELRQRLESLRPDLTLTEPDIPELEAARVGAQRMHALGYLADALTEAHAGALRLAVAIAYEQMHRTAHEGTDDPLGRRLDAVRDVVGLEKIMDVALLASAGMLIRCVRTMINPGTDDPEDTVLYAPVLQERLQYFRDTLPDLSGSLIHLDNISRQILPELPRYLDKHDSLFADEKKAGHVQEPRAEDEPDEAPEREVYAGTNLADIIQQIGEDLAARMSAESGEEVSIDVTLIPVPRPSSHQEPESGPEDGGVVPPGS